MEQSSFQDEQTVRHQFDSLCKLALKSEVINYEKHMAYRQKYEVMLSELSEKELSRLFIMDEHEMETHRFQVLGYDIEVKDALIAEALQTLTEKKRNVVLLSYFMDMSDADIVSYASPKLSSIKSERCNASGETDNDGTYFLSMTSAVFSSCLGKNALTLTVKYKRTDLKNYGNEVQINPGSNVCANNDLDPEYSYDVLYTLSDEFNTVTYSDFVSTAVYAY